MSDLLAGVDEVGRGPLAGPVVAAAVILSPTDTQIHEYQDSKKLTPKRRLVLYYHARRYCLSYAVAAASPAEIDCYNIHNATLLAMQRAVFNLSLQPQHVDVDGKFIPDIPMSCRAIIKGDAQCAHIAAASIIAKVVRDRLMCKWHIRFPVYGFAQHKGYPTKAHRLALQKHAACPIHRQSYAPVRNCGIQ